MDEGRAGAFLLKPLHMEDIGLINMKAVVTMVCTGRTEYNFNGYGSDKKNAES